MGEVIKKYSILIEAVIGIVAILYLIYVMRSMLLLGQTTLMHDNIIWGYPIFQFLAENIMNGHFPLWNPFTHGGEPFYYVLSQIRFFEPIALLVIFFGQFIISDIVMLFNWNRFIQSLVMAFGVYLVFRPLSIHLVVRLSLITILLYSSFFIGSFRQDAILNQFMWVPYITYFILRIVYYKDYRWPCWLILAGLIGLNWQSYFFTGTWIFLLFFSLGLLFFRRDLVFELFKSNMIMCKFMITIIIIFAMATPNIVFMLEREKYVFPARMINESYVNESPLYTPQQFEGEPSDETGGIIMPYSFISHTGTASNIWDFIQAIAPDGNKHIGWPDRNRWGHPSEAYIYLGFLPWAIAILGMVAGRHDLKKVWLLIALGFGLLILGPPGGLHKLLYYIYPPMWFARHTHVLVLFFVFGILYFYILGSNHILSTWHTSLFFPNNIKNNPNRASVKDNNNLADISNNRWRKALKKFREASNKGYTHYFLRRNNYIRKSVAFILFIICIVVSVHKMASLEYPATNFLFCCIILIFAAGWFLRKELGQKGLYISLVVSQIVIVLIFSTNKFIFINYIILAFGFPVALFFLIKKYGYSSKSAKYFPSFILIAIFFSFLTGDLIYGLKKSKMLYQGQKHPGLVFNVNTNPHNPSLPQNRGIQLNSNTDIRYLSLLYRQPFVFSPLYNVRSYQKEKDEVEDRFEFALNAKRFTSFFLSKKYFELINADIFPSVLKEMFAVDKPVFQIKSGALAVEENKLSDFFIKLGPNKSLRLLQEYIVVDNQMKQSLIKSGMKIVDNQQIFQAAIDVKEKIGFSYAIENYAYDDISIEASSDDAGILYWADGYDSWWRAFINEKEVSIFRANTNFKAIALPKGVSNVRFIYDPIWFKMALFIFYGSLVISVVGGGVWFLSDRSSSNKRRNEK